MESKFIPRGYVDRLRWLEINNLCDPGDASRNCPVHFIPHNQFQRPSMVRMMSEEEHESLLQSERDRALELERRLAVATEMAVREMASQIFDELTKPSIPKKGDKT
jgi:hypothetical protein